MYLLISGNGQVLGQTFSEDNARRHALVARDTMHVVLRQGDLESLPVNVRNGLLEEFGIDYDDSVKKLWNTLKKQNFPYWGKISVQRCVRHLFRDEDPHAAYTKSQLLEMIPGATWISITTALTMLKNKNYARGKTMQIKFIEGKYRRED